ncbi:MAG: IS4/IS5 family transposase, partial [Dehalococcoidia bacterium]|nr:IS4/IS5 family transposase [Dehalococcoidia bacterium]
LVRPHLISCPHSVPFLARPSLRRCCSSPGRVRSFFDRSPISTTSDASSKEHQEREWVKAHLMCGVSTHIVTSVEVTPTHAADAPMLPSLLKETARNFRVDEVSADKAYSSKRNLRAIADEGAMPYIPFKRGTMALTKKVAKQDALWQRLWGFYTYNQAVFMEHHHKRSNVETTFSMIKAKFGDTLRSRSATAQINEVLCKVLCHNICVLTQSIFELKLEPTFWAESTFS